MIQHWRLVYDVRNDGPPWLGGLLVLALLAAASGCLEELYLRRQQGLSSGGVRRPGGLAALPGSLVLAIGLFLGYLGVRTAAYSYRVYAEQRVCQRWVRTGRYQVAVGVVADYRAGKAGPRFRVAGVSFDLAHGSVGFTGRFNAPNSGDDSLGEGMRVRLGHRAGIVLRVELEDDDDGPDGERSGASGRSWTTWP